MSFLPAIAGWARVDTGPRARLHVAKTGRHLDYRRLTFVFSRELVEQAGWQAGERLVVSLGVGDDLGAFQISRVGKPGVGLKLCAHSNARGFRLTLSLPPVIHGVRPADFLDHLPAPATLTFDARDGALELRAPFRRLNQPLAAVGA